MLVHRALSDAKLSANLSAAEAAGDQAKNFELSHGETSGALRFSIVIFLACTCLVTFCGSIALIHLPCPSLTSFSGLGRNSLASRRVLELDPQLGALQLNARDGVRALVVAVHDDR